MVSDTRVSDKEKEKIEMGKRIKERRLLLKKKNSGMFTQQQVAAQLGLSREGYAHYEKGRNDVSTETLNKLAKIFDVPLTYFYGEIEAEQIALNEKMRKYTRLPAEARHAVDAQIDALAAMFPCDDTREELHDPATHSKKDE